jgi:hypothetical protein
MSTLRKECVELFKVNHMVHCASEGCIMQICYGNENKYIIYLSSCIHTEVPPVTRNLGLKFHPRSHFRARARVHPLTHNTYLPPPPPLSSYLLPSRKCEFLSSSDAKGSDVTEGSLCQCIYRAKCGKKSEKVYLVCLLMRPAIQICQFLSQLLAVTTIISDNSEPLWMQVLC